MPCWCRVYREGAKRMRGQVKLLGLHGPDNDNNPFPRCFREECQQAGSTGSGIPCSAQPLTVLYLKVVPSGINAWLTVPATG